MSLLDLAFTFAVILLLVLEAVRELEREARRAETVDAAVVQAFLKSQCARLVRTPKAPESRNG